MGPRLGLLGLLRAKSVDDVKTSLSRLSTIMLNFVFADRDGRVGRHASGRLPVRSRGDGTVPLRVTDGADNWTGWIPFEEMPHAYDPEVGWVGTCNHATAPSDYPYYYSSHQSPSYRYRRLKELLDSGAHFTAGDHWAFQRDTKNVMAERVAPVLIAALSRRQETRVMGELLSSWDFHDEPDQAAPTVFHAVYERTAFLTFRDELGDEAAARMLSNWYFWQERFQRMVLEGDSPWFDDTSTPGNREDLEALIVQAAGDVQAKYGPELGEDPEGWRWGEVHRLEFVSPIRRRGVGKGLLGGGSHAAPGSVEAL
jgi:penicillin amidase